MKKSGKLLLFISISVLFLISCLAIPFNQFNILLSNKYLTPDEFNDLTKNNFEVVSVSASTNPNMQEYVLNYKLFNLFNIKNLKVEILNNDLVYLGGESVGLSLKSAGVVVVGSNYIVTKNGNENPIKNANILVGDTITKLNDQKISCYADIDAVLKTVGTKKINVQLLRDGDVVETSITPALCSLTNSAKLGLWIKEDVTGVGTLTFVNPETLKYGSLGHAITQENNKNPFEISGGNLYKSTVVGVNKSVPNKAGEILGLFVAGNNTEGSIEKNNNFGVYGTLNKNSEFVLGKSKIKVGGRLTAKPGKAKILTTINGTTIEEFEIEIIKTQYNSGGTNKNMIIKITDEHLLEQTGGIVRGMSGSPIIQDNKIIGAVTHVFLSDPTKGFGLYLDYMIAQ